MVQQRWWWWWWFDIQALGHVHETQPKHGYWKQIEELIWWGVMGQGPGGGGRRWVVALVWRRRCGIHALRQLWEAHDEKAAQTESGYKKEGDGLQWRANGQGQCACGRRGVAVVALVVVAV